MITSDNFNEVVLSLNEEEKQRIIGSDKEYCVLFLSIFNAGFKRNEEMADHADAAIIFWDGKSKGTQHMIDCGKQRGLKLAIHKF